MEDALLAKVLAQGVGIHGRYGGGLGGGHLLGQAIAGGGRGIDEAQSLHRAGGLEHRHRAVHIGTVVFEGVDDGGHDVGQGGQMEDPGDAVEERADGRKVRRVDAMEGQGPALVRRQVFLTPVGEVVEDHDLTTLFEQAFDEVAANKARSARDEDAPSDGTSLLCGHSGRLQFILLRRPRQPAGPGHRSIVKCGGIFQYQNENPVRF